jgi:hypothetical protein
MYAPQPTTDVAVEFHVRSELPPPAEHRATQVYEGLTVLAGEGALEGLDRTTWPDRMPVEDPRPDLRDAYLAFRQWADTRGYSLAPFFQTRECYTPEYGGWTDWLVLPAMCLAIYENGDLSAVYPHTDGDETYTVQDGLEQLEGELLETDQSTIVAD